MAGHPARMSSWLGRVAPRLNFAWRGQWRPGTIEPWRHLYDHELVVFQAGECEVAVGAERLACPAGTFLIIPPDRAHRTVTGGAPVVRACIHFDWRAEEELAATPLCTFPPERPRRELVRRAPPWVPRGLLRGAVRGQRAVDDLIEAFFRRWSTRRADDRLVCRATLLELLVRLLASGDDAKASGAPDLAHAIKVRLDRSLGSGVALPALLADLGRSYEHLCRIFTACYGVPPLRYLTSARMERARELLAQPGARVAEVARAVGYADAAYFARLFRAEVGSSPRRFRGGG